MKFIDKLIIWLMQLLNDLHLFVADKYKYIPSDTKYETLLPQSKSDEDGEYGKALSTALRDPGVKNIAVTGPYGSGKSSFFKKYIHENMGWRYLQISLATFNLDKDKSRSDDRNQDIERSVLQQIFYREKTSKTPFSRFKRIQNISSKKIILNTLIISILILFICLQLFWSTTNKIMMLNSYGLVSLITKYHYVVTSVVILLYLIYSYKLFRFLMNFQVSKLSLKDGKVELDSKNSDKASIFNEYLDEILYFFEVTEYNVVIFEDLDRFGDTDIFIKLRELNTIINSSKVIRQDIRFIYALKDETFLDKERTKFFDFIIPIIPYINRSNSYEKLKPRLESEKELDQKFLSDMALYIDDMRLLINICNEYKIYKEKLNSKKINFNKLFGIITYKNFCPADFSMLHFNKSKINKVFDQKGELIKKEIANLESENENLKQKINTIQAENLENIKELRSIYLFALVSKSSATNFSVGGSGFRAGSDYLEDAAFMSLIGQQVHCRRLNGNSMTVSFSDIENEIGEYSKRERILIQKSNNSIKELKSKIESNKSNIETIRTAKLRKLMDRVEMPEFDKDSNEKELFIYLLKHGYIAEDYHYYISYFHPGSITESDREFLLSINSQRYIDDFTYHLDEVEQVVERLDINDFSERGVLNFDLISYLIHNENYNLLANVKKKLSDESDESSDFIFRYIEFVNSENMLGFMKLLPRTFWLLVMHRTEFTEEKIQSYFKLLLNNLNIDDIIAFNVDDCLSKYIEEYNCLLQLTDNENIVLIKLVQQLGLIFEKLHRHETNSKLFDYIYSNGLYHLNQENIENIIAYHGKDTSNLSTANFTTIRLSKADKLIAKIDELIKEYLESVFFKLVLNKNESAETVVQLLNNENVTSDNKLRIIEKEEAVIDDINMVIFDEDMWNKLFDCDRVKIHWDNVNYYYINIGSNDFFWEYLNQERVYLELSNTNNSNFELIGEEAVATLSKEILESEKLSDIAYSELIKSTWWWNYGSLKIDNLSDTKIDSLLELKKLKLNQHNINNLRNNVNGRIPLLIFGFQDEFINEFDQYELNAEEYAQILNSEKFNDDYKASVLEKMNKDLLAESETLATVVAKLIVSRGEPVESSIYEKINHFIDNKSKLGFLLIQAASISDDLLLKCLDDLGDTYRHLYKKSYKQYYLPKSEEHRDLLRILVSRGIISSFDITDTGDFKVNRKRK